MLSEINDKLVKKLQLRLINAVVTMFAFALYTHHHINFTFSCFSVPCDCTQSQESKSEVCVVINFMQ